VATCAPAGRDLDEVQRLADRRGEHLGLEVLVHRVDVGDLLDQLGMPSQVMSSTRPTNGLM
jgi:hypothetical protein